MRPPLMESPRPVARVASGKPYQLPDLGSGPLLHLDRNESRLDPLAWEAVAKVGDDALRCYPAAGELERELSKRLQVDPEQILVTNGGDDALLRICLAFLEPGRDLILPSPSFEMLTRYAHLAGGEILEVPWLGDDFPVEGVEQRLSERTGLVAVVSPNNPSGAVITPDQLQRLAVRAKSAMLLVDLAYTEFADVDLTPVALQSPNAVVVRTFSKAFGMAGIRCGYVAGPKAWIDCLRRAGNPYPVSGVSRALALNALRVGADFQQQVIQQVRAEREWLYGFLQDRGLAAQRSHANFVQVRTPHAAAIWQGLLEQGIAVRWFPANIAEDNRLRITCPAREQDRVRLELALENVWRRLSTES